ncbi:RNA 3'-terminal phosphate cyclase [Massilia sp. CF038]|uniref:RNA 3'-terminal phosphate cyclase n=1 Tax=Massilia sp. CF038 TaxID=1881045 RepID=UPI000913FF2C|nr:RNA 3'-terminal phosphate cyclase [Massilia sp. CF038]SHH72584.1 RNA 3'-terminal phosphate cyclase (ATP) [Massilia sp. CF038]
MIELDGATGEGGGQVLRSALTLSMITGQPFRIVNIRAGRAKPGLLRQHLVAVQAAAAVSGATVAGAELGSTSLTFSPRAIKGGDYQFAIGSAGSCTLVLQTLIPALLFADAPSSVRVSGGTHNPMAPPAQFLQRSYVPLLAAMGANVDVALLRAGFFPAGGGVVVATVTPCVQLKQLSLMERGERRGGYAEALVAGIPGAVGQRELECVGTGMGWGEEQLLMRGLPAEQGPGNALLITLEYEHVTEVVVAFGEKAVRSEIVAKHAVNEARRYIASGAAVGEHLADQLMLPMALAGGGSFTAESVSQHALTNAEVISVFLPVTFSFEKESLASGERHTIRVATVS